VLFAHKLDPLKSTRQSQNRRAQSGYFYAKYVNTPAIMPVMICYDPDKMTPETLAAPGFAWVPKHDTMNRYSNIQGGDNR
jgi:hypothetical protein